jgi:hypothetical protein
MRRLVGAVIVPLGSLPRLRIRYIGAPAIVVLVAPQALPLGSQPRSPEGICTGHYDDACR